MNLKNRLIMAAALGLALNLSSCGDPDKSARGFRLPDGDASMGQEAFVALECHRCHRVDGVALPEFAGEAPLSMELGGEVHRVKTHGQLVASIINPDHVISEQYLAKLPEGDRRGAEGGSPMPGANDTMTVTQMIDIVAFLQPHYRRILPDDNIYYGP